MPIRWNETDAVGFAPLDVPFAQKIEFVFLLLFRSQREEVTRQAILRFVALQQIFSEALDQTAIQAVPFGRRLGVEIEVLLLFLLPVLPLYLLQLVVDARGC